MRAPTAFLARRLSSNLELFATPGAPKDFDKLMLLRSAACRFITPDDIRKLIPATMAIESGLSPPVFDAVIFLRVARSAALPSPQRIIPPN